MNVEVVIVTLLSIHDKSEVSTLNDSEVKELIDNFLKEKSDEEEVNED